MMCFTERSANLRYKFGLKRHWPPAMETGGIPALANGIKQVKVSRREGRPCLERCLLALARGMRDVSGGSAVVIDLVGVMASFYFLV